MTLNFLFMIIRLKKIRDLSQIQMYNLLFLLSSISYDEAKYYLSIHLKY